MGMMEDIRQSFDDFIAPELRAVSGRIGALNARFDLLDAKFSAVDARISRMETNIASQIDSLKSSFEFDKRISRLEAMKEKQTA